VIRINGPLGFGRPGLPGSSPYHTGAVVVVVAIVGDIEAIEHIDFRRAAGCWQHVGAQQAGSLHGAADADHVVGSALCQAAAGGDEGE
jgi:hypothetical protein